MGLYFNSFSREFNIELYLAASVLSVVVYLPLVAWLAIAAGLKIRTQARAIIAATGGLVVWCIAPVLFVTLPLGILRPSLGQGMSYADYDVLIKCSSLLSPAAILPFIEFDNLSELRVPWVVVLANFTCYVLVLVLVRTVCLRNADRWLGRTAGDVQQAGN